MKLFDAHFHIIDPNYPLVTNQGYLPPTFSVENYLNNLEGYELVGGALVSGSFQAFDQEYLVDALSKMGEGFYGVANVSFDMTDQELQRLDRSRVKAVRFNLKRGGSEAVEHLELLANKLNTEFGWHTELYVDSSDLIELLPALKRIPAFSIDHLGLSQTGLDQLYKCVELGARVKATGFGRIDFDPVPVMKKIMDINPRALLFGTDLPSTRARVPFSTNDVDLINRNFSEPDQERIFFKNALKWYNE